MRPERLRQNGFWVLAWVLLYPIAASPDDQQAELERLRVRIKEATSLLNQDQAEQTSVQRQLDEVELEMAKLNRALHETESRIASSNVVVEKYEAEVTKMHSEMDASRTQLSRLVYAGYVAGRAEYFKLLLNQQEPGLLGRNLAYYRYLSQRRIDHIRDVERKAARLQQLKDLLEAENKELNTLMEAQLSRQEDLQVARIERGVILDQLRRRIGSRKKELEDLKRNEARLNRLLEDLKNAMADIPPESILDQRFGDMRGRLALPVDGAISARFGQIRGRSGVQWEGIFMTADEGTTVRAIFPGRVAFADWLRGFGLLLILDHGDGYMSLYSHGKLLYKQVGEWVDAGEPIAQVGSSGGLTDAGLYFEIRHNGEPHNPLIWCKVE